MACVLITLGNLGVIMLLSRAALKLTSLTTSKG
jgi:hypothetical protein